MTLEPLWLVVALLTACGRMGGPGKRAEEQAAERGRVTMKTWGCGSCHVIPGVRGASGLVGPSLDRFAYRAYIAGRLPNQPENLVRWIEDPLVIDPQTAMPDLAVPRPVASDMAAYLYSLR